MFGDIFSVGNLRQRPITGNSEMTTETGNAENCKISVKASSFPDVGHCRNCLDKLPETSISGFGSRKDSYYRFRYQSQFHSHANSFFELAVVDNARSAARISMRFDI